MSSSLVLACGPGKDDTSEGSGSGSESETTSATETETETETGAQPAECNGELCNPLDPSDCDAGGICIFFNTEFQCFPYSGDGSGVAGAPCETATACEPGLSCIQGVFFADCAGDACCAPNCSVADPEVCAPGEVCDPWSLGDDADPCYGDVGVCITPP